MIFLIRGGQPGMLPFSTAENILSLAPDFLLISCFTRFLAYSVSYNRLRDTDSFLPEDRTAFESP